MRKGKRALRWLFSWDSGDSLEWYGKQGGGRRTEGTETAGEYSRAKVRSPRGFQALDWSEVSWEGLGCRHSCEAALARVPFSASARELASSLADRAGIVAALLQYV